MTTVPTEDELFFFSRQHLDELADRYRDEFAQAAPFPHVVIDDFLPREVALRVAHSFPTINQIQWKLEGPGDSQHSGDKHIEKVTTSDEEKFPPYVRFMMGQFQSGVFVNFLDRLTGFQHLQPDPNHYGCGLHSTGRGGRLMLHLDASRHPNKDLNQLINCIYYCSPDWEESYGGGLELWNSDASERIVTVPPLFNRLAIFNVSGKSWHGHPHPIDCPPDKRRNSLALYYYTTDKSLTGYAHSNFVRWKAVTEHDKSTGLQKMKAAIRDHLPTPVVNAIAAFARKTGLNFKPKK